MGDILMMSPMGDILTDGLNSFFAGVWSKVHYYITFQFADPFWYWVWWAAVAVGVIWLIDHFFGSRFPIVRVICGVFLIDIIIALFSYRRGEKEARDHDKPKKKR